jgi:hypothetical protein
VQRRRQIVDRPGIPRLQLVIDRPRIPAGRRAQLVEVQVDDA